MEKLKSKKLEKWTSHDTANNVIVAIFNVIITFAIFNAMRYFTALRTNPDTKFLEVFSDVTSVIHTIVLLMLTAAVIVVYFFFEDRNFLKNSANLEMMFLIVEYIREFLFLLHFFILMQMYSIF